MIGLIKPVEDNIRTCEDLGTDQIIPYLDATTKNFLVDVVVVVVRCPIGSDPRVVSRAITLCYVLVRKYKSKEETLFVTQKREQRQKRNQVG